MKYALLNDEIQEAQPGLAGKCKSCKSPTVAKCGKLKIWHWSHRGKRMCDPWWENETEWHRAWKGQFPKECQEFIQKAENGEKHIADVKVDQGYVIEFQHSHIKLDERQSREDFYKKMVWIVDGTRRSRDKDKFMDVLEYSEKVDGNSNKRIIRHFYKCALLRDWDGSNAPVFFDFGEDVLWGFVSKTIEDRKYVFRFERNILIASLHPAAQVGCFDALVRGCTNSIEINERSLQRKARGRMASLFMPRH